MNTMSTVELQLRLSVNAPALYDCVKLLLPLAQAEHSRLSNAAAVATSPKVRDAYNRLADKGLEGIVIGEPVIASFAQPNAAQRAAEFCDKVLPWKDAINERLGVRG